MVGDFPNDHTQLSQEMYDMFIERILQMAEYKDKQYKSQIQELNAELGMCYDRITELVSKISEYQK